MIISERIFYVMEQKNMNAVGTLKKDRDCNK